MRGRYNTQRISTIIYNISSSFVFFIFNDVFDMPSKNKNGYELVSNFNYVLKITK